MEKQILLTSVARFRIAGAAGDQQSALFGQTCFNAGEAKIHMEPDLCDDEYREKPVSSKNGLVTTIAWGLDGKVNYALEGFNFRGRSRNPVAER